MPPDSEADRHRFAVSLARDLRAAARIPRAPAPPATGKPSSSPLLEYHFSEIEARGLRSGRTWD